MTRLPKGCLVLIGIMFVFVGGLHLNVHFNELLTDELQTKLSFSTPVMGQPMDVYPAWQGFSFMMGVSFIAIGLLCAVQGFRSEQPSPMTFLILAMLFGAVIFSGIYYFGDKQIYGGGVGLVIAIVGLLTRPRRRDDLFRH